MTKKQTRVSPLERQALSGIERGDAPDDAMKRFRQCGRIANDVAKLSEIGDFDMACGSKADVIAGFGVPSTFGGVIPTPTMDQIAQEGLRYTRMFSTALCSPTRAALITGRNHHSAGFGVISAQSTGYPGYNSIIAKDKATVGRILLDNGYHTSWFGKDHNTPAFAASQAGPFNQWPTGMGLA